MREKLAALLLGLLGISPLFLLPHYWSIGALLCFLPFLLGLGLPVSVSYLGLSPRDPLFIPLSVVSGIVWIGTVHLFLLHVGGRPMAPYALVAGGALFLWVYRHDLRSLWPTLSLRHALAVLLVLYPQIVRVQFRAWKGLVAPDGGVVGFFNNSQSANIVVVRDVAQGIPMKSSVTYPLIATYHAGGHALVDLFRVLGRLTPFEANFIVVNLFVVLMGELALLWLIARWFLESFWSRLLFVAALSYLSGDAVRILLIKGGLIPETWVFGGDHTRIFELPYVSTNVPRMAGLLVALWVLYVVFERVRQGRPAGLGWAVGLGVLLGSVYYYKNTAFIALLPGFALAAAFRAYRERCFDLCVMAGTGALVGVAIHLYVFSYGGAISLGLPLQMLRSWGVAGGSLLLALLVYLLGWSVRALGLLALAGGWREIRSSRILLMVVILLLGTFGSGFFLSNFFSHSVVPDPSVPTDSPFYRYIAPAEDGLSVHNVNFRQIIYLPHAFVSIFLLGFLIRWIERGALAGRWMSWTAAALLCLAIVGGVDVARQAFAYGQKPQLADDDLRAALRAIPRDGSLTAANFVNWAVASLEGHRFYFQPTAFFNDGAVRPLLRERADHQYRLFSTATSDGERRRVLAAMRVTHLLIKKDVGGPTEVSSCAVYYENRRYVVCRVGKP